MSGPPDDHTGQCCTCHHWDADRDSDKVDAQGMCRKKPPVFIGMSDDGFTPDWSWPWTMGADWCGKWTRRTN